MEQLRVEFPEREPDKAETAHGVERVITATLDMVFFNGKKWFPYTATHELYVMKGPPKSQETRKQSAKKHLFRWLTHTLQEGIVEVDGEPVQIYAVAAEPIYEELEV